MQVRRNTDTVATDILEDPRHGSHELYDSSLRSVIFGIRLERDNCSCTGCSYDTATRLLVLSHEMDGELRSIHYTLVIYVGSK